MKKDLIVAGLVICVGCSSRVDVFQDTVDEASQGMSMGSTGGAANVFTLSQTVGTQSQFTLDGVTESVSEFNGVLTVSVPVFASGGMSGAIHYSSSRHILRSDGTLVPQHQGVAGAWNSNFFGRFVENEVRLEKDSTGMFWPQFYPGYYVETPGGGRLSWLMRGAPSNTASNISPRLPSTQQPLEGLLEDGSVVLALPDGSYAVLSRGGGRTDYSHRVSAEWDSGAEGIYATRIQSLDGKTIEVRYYGQTPIPREATEYWPTENGGRVAVARVFFFLEEEGLRLGSIRYPGALSRSRTELGADWLETRFSYDAQQLASVHRAAGTTSFRYSATAQRLLLGIERPSGSRVDFTYGLHRMPVGYCVPFEGVCESDIVRDNQGYVVLGEDEQADFRHRPWFEAARGVTARTLSFEGQAATWRWLRFTAQHPDKPQKPWAQAENYYSVTEIIPPAVVAGKQVVTRRYFGVPQKQGSPEAAKTGLVLLERMVERRVSEGPCEGPGEETAFEETQVTCQTLSERLLQAQDFAYAAYPLGTLKAIPPFANSSAALAEFMRGFVWRAYPMASILSTPGTSHKVVTYFGNPQRSEESLRRFGLLRFSENEGGEYDLLGHAPAQVSMVTDDENVHIVPAKTVCAPLRCRVVSPSRTESTLACTEDFSCKQDNLSHVPAPISPAHYVKSHTEYLVDTAEYDSQYDARLLFDLPVTQKAWSASGQLLSHSKVYYDNRGYSPGCALEGGDTSTLAKGRVTATQTLDVQTQMPSLWDYTRYALPSASTPPSGILETLSGPLCVGQRMTYSPVLNVSGHVDGTGQPTQTDAVYFETGQRRLRTQSRAAYNAIGQVLVTEDENQARARTDYDFRGRPLAIYRPGRAQGPSQTFSYVDTNVAAGQAFVPSSVTTRTHDVITLQSTVFVDSLGRTFHTQTQGDNSGAPVVLASSARFLGATGLVQASTRPYVIAQGSATQVFSPPSFHGARNEVTYDFLGRSIEAHDIGTDGSRRSLGRSEYGDSMPGLLPLQSAFISPHGEKTVTTFDAWGRTSSVRLADDSVTYYTHDALGRVVKVTHPDGLSTTFEFDGLGRKVKEARPESGVSHRTYDAAGLPLQDVDANGAALYYQHDGLGRQVKVLAGDEVLETVFDHYPANSPFVGSPFARGRITRKVSAASVEDFRYDVEGRVVEMVTTLSGLSGQKRQVYEYSDTGRLLASEYQPGTSESLHTSMQYDALLRPVSSTLKSFLRSTVLLGRLSYDVEGRLSKREFLPQRNLHTEVISYDAFGRQRGMNVPSDFPNTLFGYRVGYEDAIPGNTPRHDDLPSFVEWTQPVAGPATAFFQYDVRGQLTRAQLQTNGVEDTSKTLSIQYDKVGNILSLSRGGAATLYQYETGTRRLHGVTGANQGTFAYNASGQLLADSRFAASTSSYSHPSYSPRGYTETVSNVNERLRFAHDASGQKVATYHEVLAQGAAASLSGRHFVRSPSGDIVAEYQDGQLVRQPLGNLGSLETGREGRSGLQFHLKDFLGSVRVRLHESGAVLEVTDFDAFGVEWADRSRNQDGVDGPKQFTGYTSHKELPTPFYHANARLYDAHLGRFFRPDPLADLEPVTTAYAYARNAPTAMVDPTGLYNQGPGDPPRKHRVPTSASGPWVPTVTAPRISFSSYAVARMGGLDVTDYAQRAALNAATAPYRKWLFEDIGGSVFQMPMGVAGYDVPSSLETVDARYSRSDVIMLLAGESGSVLRGASRLVRLQSKLGERAMRSAYSKSFKHFMYVQGDLPFLDDFAVGQGFPGVYDISTRGMRMRPSVSDPFYLASGKTLPPGFLPRNTSHIALSVELGGNMSGHYGFTAIINGPKTVELQWLSRSVNKMDDDYLVPPNLRREIVKQFEERTGYSVTHY